MEMIPKLTDAELGSELLSHGKDVVRLVVQFGAFRVYPSIMNVLEKVDGFKRASAQLNEKNPHIGAILQMFQRVNGIKLAAHFFLNNMLIFPDRADITGDPSDAFKVEFNPSAMAMLCSVPQITTLVGIDELMYGLGLAFAVDMGLEAELEATAPPDVAAHARNIRQRLEAQVC
jgi:hypothetical protein